jgi:Spy/CpxP family protein refolding chaperone
MKIRRLFVYAVAVGAMGGLSLMQAQEQKKGRGQGGGRGGTPEQRIERLEQAVGSLTADQKDKIKAIYEKAAEKMQGLSEDERRQKAMEIMKESSRQVRALLTPDQQKKFDEMMAQARGGREGGGGGRKKQDD